LSLDITLPTIIFSDALLIVPHIVIVPNLEANTKVSDFKNSR